MKQVLQYPKRNGLTLAECPRPGCKPGGLVVKNHCSLISPGTERAIMDLAEKNLMSKARSRPDLVKQVIDKARTEGIASTFNKVQARLKAPIPLGYSSAGTVVEVAADVTEFAVGDRVACAGFGYASHAEHVYVPRNLAVRLPQGIDFEQGSFVTLGAIALWGVRQAAVTLGERVAVIGMGLLGQLTVQILKASGCQVIAVDIDEQRLKEALRFEPALAVNLSEATAAKAILHYTAGVGVDVTLITAATKSNEPLEFAAQIARDRARVTIVGDVRMEVPRKAFYDKELTLVMSRSYGPGRYDPIYEERGIDYPAGYVRWTENRNMSAFLELVAAGKVDVKSLTTASYPIEHALTAFERIENEKVLGVLLNYDVATEEATPATITRSSAPTKGEIAVGFLGAGLFATGVLLPALSQNPLFHRTLLYSPTPHRARAAADQFDFAGIANSEAEVLEGADIGTVFVATPHNCHAEQIMRALEAGKNVFVEKPLCLTLEELAEIRRLQSERGTTLMVGFNRRYSSCTRLMHRELARRTSPAIINYSLNPGFIDKNSWVHDDKIGGGRIIGEACHFIDLICHLLDARVSQVRTTSIMSAKGRYQVDDNVQIQLTMSDGSIATITYAAMGDRSYPKESLEIFADGAVITMSDWQRVEHFVGGRRRSLYRGSMDKGFRAEMTALAAVIRSGRPAEELEADFHSSLVALEARRSLAEGGAILIA